MASYYQIGPEFASIMQGGVQYTSGITTGYLVDQTFTLLGKQFDHPVSHLFLMVLQAGVNGLALRFLLPYIHGDTMRSAYQDPTGGYLMAMGLIHGQPMFAEKSKAFISGLIETVEDKFKKPSPEDAEN